jgi:hypothetical protein
VITYCTVNFDNVNKPLNLINLKCQKFLPTLKVSYNYHFFSLFNFELAELKKIEPSCEAGEFLRPLTKCFSSTETSSNKADAFRYEFYNYSIKTLFS